jgi:hypothetical protein
MEPACATIWCSLVITVGFLVGDQLAWMVYVANRAGHWLAAAAFLTLASMFLIWWRNVAGVGVTNRVLHLKAGDYPAICTSAKVHPVSSRWSGKTR